MWRHLAKMKFEDLMTAVDDQRLIRLGLNSTSHITTWVTGWQRAAIRMFPQLLKRCDVVVEVRDARMPWVTAHPDIPGWCRPKPRVIVLTKADLVPPAALEETIRCLNASAEDQGIPVIAVNARQGGREVEDLRTELLKAGAYVNRHRIRKGVNPRAVRVMMAGFPNVGKSAVINALAGRKVAPKGGATGQTVTPTWHMIGGFRNTELAFLDMPGVMPEQFNKRYSEEEVSMMMMCRLISDKVIDFEKCGHDLLFHLARLSKENPHCVEKGMWREMSRLYDVDMAAAVRHEGPYASTRWDWQNMAAYCQKLISDFNKGLWGKIQLEPPPVSQEQADIFGGAVQREAQRVAGRKVDDTKLARRPAGLLPPGRRVVNLPTSMDKDRPRRMPELVSAKGYGDEGLFDGW
ncbi:unnamed protein product [Prorocentrum cordatum]|uniref:G domain-containing protein n=1 Tax=Prorocentrum cordatum TaxID=2364126 RepID=A0ABN9UN70_9DINO|nr:unnamed protein product [Polarella glacialis]